MELEKLNEKAVLSFIDKMLTLYFEKRDMNGLSLYLEERTSWIGTGEGEMCENIVEAGKALSAELNEYQGSFLLVEKTITFVQLSNTSGIVYGMLKAVPNDKQLSDEDVRFSVVLEQSENGIKIVHIHFSHPDLVQEKGTFYVKKSERVDNQSLRTELNIREQKLLNLTTKIPGGAHQCANEPNLTLLSMSDGFLSMFGYTREEIETQFENKYINMIYPSDRADTLKLMYKQLNESKELELEYRVLRKVGQPIWVLDKGRLLDDGDGGECFYCLLIDITERKSQQEELRLSMERYNVVVNQASDIIFEWDILKDTLEFSGNWKKRFGYDAIDKKISKRIPLSHNIHPDDVEAFVKVIKNTVSGTSYTETELRIRNSVGKFFWCRIRVTAQYSADGRPIKAIGVIVDIDEEKRLKQVLLQQAQFDTLTGIYNKSTINALVEQRLWEKREAIKDNHNYHALMIIDVDHFKDVNDNYGHLCGDSVLSNVAVALKSTISQGELVGRIGGDEFLVYLPKVDKEETVREKAKQIVKALSCIRPEPGAHCITCSIGVAVLPRTQNDYARLYQTADSALYQRKNEERGGYTFFDPNKEIINVTKSNVVVNKAIVSDEGMVTDEWLAQYAFRTLYEAKNIESSLNRLLEIIGRAFDVSRVYIFENSEDGQTCRNTFEWCADGIIPQIDNLQEISYDDLGDYLKNFDEHGVFYCNNIKTLPLGVYAVLKPQGVQSLLQCVILDEGQIIGYFGFDECREVKQWSKGQIDSFKLTANVMSTFLTKLRDKQKNKKAGK